MSVADAGDGGSLESAWLEELRGGEPATKGDIVDELGAIFLRDAATTVETLRTAVANGEAREVMAAAHRLKGSSGTIRAVRLADLAEQLEKRAARGDLADARVQVDALHLELGVVRALLARVCGTSA